MGKTITAPQYDRPMSSRRERGGDKSHRQNNDESLLDTSTGGIITADIRMDMK